MRPSQLLAAVVALSSVTVATSNVFDSINALGEAKHMFVARQNDENTARTSEEPATTEAPRKTDSATETEKPTATKSDAKTTDKNDKETGKETGTASKTSSKKPKVTNFGPDVQPGGIAMVTPNQFAGQQYYKVGDWVTFAWNYTSVSLMPSHIDVMASCSVNQQTYTVAVNMSAKATKVLWDTKGYQSKYPNSPDFVSEMYTLMIYDSNGSPTDVPKPGLMAPFRNFYFGMYTPRPYKRWEDWECPNCLKNDALSLLSTPTSRVLLFTFGTTIASFLYFANAFGII